VKPLVGTDGVRRPVLEVAAVQTLDHECLRSALGPALEVGGSKGLRLAETATTQRVQVAVARASTLSVWCRLTALAVYSRSRPGADSRSSRWMQSLGAAWCKPWAI